ncbi:MAG: Holliday junction resolvase-like protein [Nanoarchaeota archaeon]
MKLFEEFQEFRKILCVCPDCGMIVRVSDLKLKVKGVSIKTWLDEYEAKSRLMDNKEEKFEEIKDKLREIAVKKGRKEAEKMFNQVINPTFRELKFDPFDIKPILNPIDFIVFKDMNKKEQVNDIIFLSKICNNPILNNLRVQVKGSIEKKKYDWQVARIDERGKIKVE